MTQLWTIAGYNCPTCKTRYNTDTEFKHCPTCGRMLQIIKEYRFPDLKVEA